MMMQYLLGLLLSAPRVLRMFTMVTSIKALYGKLWLCYIQGKHPSLVLDIWCCYSCMASMLLVSLLPHNMRNSLFQKMLWCLIVVVFNLISKNVVVFN